MIVSTTDIKLFLGLSDSTEYDTLIGALIEPCLNDVFDYTKNYFHNNAVRYTSNLLTFSSTAQTIVVDGYNFSTEHFATGDELHIFDSARNDGFYTSTLVSSATITISTLNQFDNTLVDEEEELNTTIVKVDFPASLVPTVASMIKWRIDHNTGVPLSERLGDYSITYGSGYGTDYPVSITKALDKYRLVGFA